MKKTLGIVLFALLCTLSIRAQVVTSSVDDYSVCTVKSISSGRFMQVAGDLLYNQKYKDGALITQHVVEKDEEAKPQKYQRWHIIYVSTENEVKYYAIRSTMSGKLLDVPAGALVAGVQLQQSAENTVIANRMLWSIVEVSTGKFRITNKNSGLVLTNKDASILDDTPISQEVNTDADNQLWEINKQLPCSYRDDKVVKFFERNKRTFGSSAFDQGSSILLSNGRTLWITQDSWDGNQLQTTKNLFSSSNFFSYGNSMFIQPSLTDWSPDNAPNITRLNSAQGRPKQICDIQSGQSFAWPSNGVEIDGKVYLICGEGQGLSQTTQTLYEIYPSSTGSSVWTSIRHVVPGLSNYNTINYATGMVKADDGYAYVFGSRGLGFGYSLQIFVARFSQADPFNNWTFWDGSTWTNKPPTTDAEYTKAKLFEGTGASAAVSYVNGKFVLITLDQGFWVTTSRFVRGTVSASPTSKFAASKKLYNINEYTYGTQARYYSPNVHPQFKNENDELLFTYSLNFNADDKQDITVNASGEKIVNGVSVVKGPYIDPYFYRVKGVRVPYSVLGIPSSVPASIVDTKIDAKETIEIYPNPVQDYLNLSSKIALEGAVYQVYNAMGSLLKEGQLQGDKVNVETLPAGFYKLVIKKDNQTIAKSFLKK